MSKLNSHSTARFLPSSDAAPVADEDRFLCGIGNWHPQWMQRFANVKIFSVNLAFINLTYICFFTYFVGVLTTMEKRFEFPSKGSGVLMACNDVTHLTFIILVSHFAAGRRRPFFIGVAGLLFALGSILFAIPHFIFGPRSDGLDFSKLDLSTQDTGVETSRQALELCNVSAAERFGAEGLVSTISSPPLDDGCEEGGGNNKVAFGLMVTAELFIGMGTSTIFPLGVSYMDDNVKSKVSPLYMSFFLAARTCGPIFGFLLSALCTSFYVDFSEPPLDSKDPRWIGAWWFGYILVGVVMGAASIPLLFYPKELKAAEGEGDAPEVKSWEAGEPRGNETDPEQSESKLEQKAISMLVSKPKELLKVVYQLLTNPVYICIVLGGCANLYTISSVKIFMPKYLEQQFGVNTSMANIYTGIVGVASATIGLVSGGYLMKKLRVQPRGAVVITIIGTAILFLSLFLNMFLGCDNHSLAAEYRENGEHAVDFQASCQAPGCQCSRTQFSPVCGEDGRNYFSACAAGCTTTDLSDCWCVPGNQTALPGYCDRGCTSVLFGYLAVMFVAGLMASPASVTNLLVMLRCVKKEQKAIALGFASFLQSIITWLPGPIIAGALIDKSCLYWQTNKCSGETGSCWIYDNAKFRYTIHGFAISWKVVALILYAVAWWKCKGPYLGGKFEKHNVNETEMVEKDSKSNNN